MGLFASRHSPENAFGRLLLAAGAGWFLVSMASSDVPALYSLGRVAAWPEEALLVSSSSPSRAHGPTRPRRAAVVGIAVAVVLVLYLPTALLVGHYPTPSAYSICGSDCPANAFQLTRSQPAFVNDFVLPLREALTVGIFVATALILLSRLLRSTPVLRRTLAPVLLAASVSTFAVAVYLAARRSGAADSTLDALTTVRGFATPIAGLGFLISALLWQLFEARALEQLALSPALAAPPARLQRLLGDAFGDPTLELRFEEGGVWRDANGEPVAAPPNTGERCVVSVEGGAIVCDPGLKTHERLVRAAGSWVAMATDRERLNRLLRGSLRDVEESRRRLETAAATERRRIERDLHDGAQQRLVTLRVQLELIDEELARDPVAGARRLRELGPGIDAAIDEVRSLAGGIYPPLLADAGLAEALRGVALREALPLTVAVEVNEPLRYPLEIESAAYFCCLEALQNATKHSGAEAVTVEVDAAPDLLRFVVHDAGRGFSVNGAQRRSRAHEHARPPRGSWRSPRDRVSARRWHSRNRQRAHPAQRLGQRMRAPPPAAGPHDCRATHRARRLASTRPARPGGTNSMLLANTDYPFLNILGSMFFFFMFVIWIWLLFTVFGDLFRRHDIGGWGKAGWIVLMLVLPYLGVFLYLITQGKAMAERKAEEIAAAQSQFDQYVRQTAGAGTGPADQISQAKELLDKGAINQAEFEDLKKKALG